MPAAHYSCGGVWVDDDGRSTLDRLYAIGEVSCTGVHGANRLASTSLLEGLVWGHRSARHIAESLEPRGAALFDDIPQWRTDRRGGARSRAGRAGRDARSSTSCGTTSGWCAPRGAWRARSRDLRNLEVEIERFYRAAALSDELIGLRNSIRVALIVTLAAWENRESRGCHHRE